MAMKFLEREGDVGFDQRCDRLQVGRTGSPLHAEEAAPTGVVALPCKARVASSPISFAIFCFPGS